MTLGKDSAGQYQLGFDYHRPGELAASSLGLLGPRPVTFQAARLRALLDDPPAYGARLAGDLFGDEQARLAFEKALNQLPLRINLKLDPQDPFLLGLRWETLHYTWAGEDQAAPLATNQNLPFARFLTSLSPLPVLMPDRPRLKALIAVANPPNLPQGAAPIRVQQELERARTWLDRFERVELAPPQKVTLDALTAALQGGVDVLYLVAHGFKDNAGRYTVLLDDPSGAGPGLAPVAELARRVSELAQRPLLAILVSCESAGNALDDPADATLLPLGPALVVNAGVPAVLAMQGRVSFETMDVFLPAFFRALRRDGQLDRALAAARGLVRDHPDWWMPVLFSRLNGNYLPQPPITPVNEALLEQAHDLLRETGAPLQTLLALYDRSLPRFLVNPPEPRPASLWSILLALAQIRVQPDSALPLLEFARQAAAETGDPDLKTRLRAWMEALADSLGLPAGAAAPAASAGVNSAGDTASAGKQRGYLMVKLTPDSNNINAGKDKKYQLQISLWQNGQTVSQVHTGGEALPLKEIPPLIFDQLIHSDRWLPPDLTDLVVEFFLPYELLTEPVDQWQTIDDGGLGQDVVLGETFPLNVRSLERTRISALKQIPWRRRWECYQRRLQAGGATSEDLVAIYDDGSLPPNLIQSLRNPELPVGLGFALLNPPADGWKMLGGAIHAGVPIALWARRGSEPVSPGQDLVTRLKALLDRQNLPGLPELVWNERRIAGPACNLTLLYDDPTRLPAEAPRTTGPATLEE